jgi:hypothetical protein
MGDKHCFAVGAVGGDVAVDVGKVVFLVGRTLSAKCVLIICQVRPIWSWRDDMSFGIERPMNKN